MQVTLPSDLVPVSLEVEVPETSATSSVIVIDGVLAIPPIRDPQLISGEGIEFQVKIVSAKIPRWSLMEQGWASTLWNKGQYPMNESKRNMGAVLVSGKVAIMSWRKG
jgi:hypothetical protein